MKTLKISLIASIIYFGINLLANNYATAQNYQRLSNDLLVNRLSPQQGKINVVVDTDTYNEIDDQFAVVYALLSPEKMNVKAIYAAPYLNKRSESPLDGMQKSYEEIHRLLEKLNWPERDFVFKGSTEFLKDLDSPIKSDAALDLIEKANASESPLYVLTLGAPTNVASAILLDPSITEKIIVVWLGGKGLNWPMATEFNLMQDPLASQVLFNSGVPLIQIPTEPVSSHLQTTIPEMEYYLEGKGEIGDYLLEIFKDYNTGNTFGWSKVIWDISAIAYVINPAWFRTELRSTPILTDQLTYSFDHSRHLYRVALHLNRDRIFSDLYQKIQDHVQ